MPKYDGPRLAIEPVREPPKPWTRPRYQRVEVRYRDGSWRPAIVLAWHKPAKPSKSIMSAWPADWLVMLMFPDETKGWYRYTGQGHIRPRT